MTRLRALLESAGLSTDGVADVSVTAVTADSRAVRPGALFVAVPGTVRDGHDFMDEALARGAAAIVVQRVPSHGTHVPIVRVADTRRALAVLAAAYHGHPGRRVPLIGITGTVGKTSVLSQLDAMLVAAGMRPAAIGSLGVTVGGERLDVTQHTTPDAVRLQEELAEVVAAGSDIVAMEVTSHALVQDRVHGLHYGLGVFTNLLPLEHGDYHGSFRSYVDAKLRFFDHLAGDAPLVFNADDRAVSAIARARARRRIAVSIEKPAAVRLHSARLHDEGTRAVLAVRRPIPALAGGTAGPVEIPVSTRLRGPSALRNAALAAAAALCAGADGEAIARALEDFRPLRRRTEILHRGEFTILDDTVGHPESVSALFTVVRLMRPRRVHIAFAIRGRRGIAINQELAGALAVYARRFRIASLIVTPAADVTDERNRVSAEERESFLHALSAGGAPYEAVERLDDAVPRVLERASPRDLVLLLGAQGMDRGAEIARAWLATASH